MQIFAFTIGVKPEICKGGGLFGGLGAEPPALEIFVFVCKNNLILDSI